MNSFATSEAKPTSKTLRGLYVPKQLAESIRRQEEERRREAGEKIMVVQKCMAKKPNGAEERARVDAAIKWLGENAERLDEAQKLGAFFPIARLVEAGFGRANPLEAGLAMSRIARSLGMLNAIFGVVREKIIERMKAAISREMGGKLGPMEHHLVFSAAGLGEPKAARLAMFWMGMRPEEAGRIASVHPEMMESIRKEMEAGARASAGK